MERWRQVQGLLWDEIAALLNPGEQDVVRKTIGSHLIDENEVLYKEADAYEEILEFVDQDMQKHIASHKILDTPARQMLEKEIKSLVQAIQQQSDAAASGSEACETESTSGSTSVSVAPSVSVAASRAAPQLADLKGACKNTLDYVLSKNAIQEKMRNGRSSSCSISSVMSSSTTCTVRPGKAFFLEPSLVVKSMQPHLNVSGIDEVTDRLQQAFAAEHEALLEDVEFLRACLEESTEMYASVKNNPPTINDMKDCGKKLEELFTSFKHCRNIQNILVPNDRLQGGGELSPGCRISVRTSELLPKRAIRLPKMVPRS